MAIKVLSTTDILGATFETGSPRLTVGAPAEVSQLNFQYSTNFVFTSYNNQLFLQTGNNGVMTVGAPTGGNTSNLVVQGYVDAKNFKINGAQGSDGQVLTSTGSGVAWESVSTSGGDITAVVAGAGLHGGSTSGSATLNLDIDGTNNYIEMNNAYTPASGDFIPFSDIADGTGNGDNNVVRKTTFSNFPQTTMPSIKLTSIAGSSPNTSGSAVTVPLVNSSTGVIQSWASLNRTYNGVLTVTGSSGLTGSGTFGANQSSNTTITLSHSDTSSQSSVNNSSGTVIQDVTLDTYGHVTSLGSVNLDSRYFTESESDNRYVLKAGGTFEGDVTVEGRLQADDGFSSDGANAFHSWRALQNTTSSSNQYYRIARISGSQSSRFIIEIAGRSTSYGDNALPAFGKIVGQLNNDNNYDIVYYNASATDEVVDEVGQVDVGTSATDIYVRVGQFAELTATAHISDGSISPYDSNSGSTSAPTGYVQATEYKLWNTGNDGSGSGLDADTLDGQHASAFLTAHPNISAASSSNNSGNTFIQDITLDSNGHVTGLATGSASGFLTSESDTLATVTGRGASTSTSTTFSGGLVASGGISGLTLTNGISGSNFNISGVNQLSINDPGEGIVFGGGSSGNITLTVVDDASDNILRVSGTGATLQVGTNRVLTTADEGSGNGLDADTLDGNHASAFLTAHPNISAASSSNNSGRTYIQDITLDSNGHVTGIATATETVTAPTVNNGTLTVQGTGALGGSGTFTANQSGNTTISISHDDTSSQSSINNSSGTVIQDVTLDGYGHVTSLGSVNLDGRYYTESEMQTFFDRGYIESHSASNLAVGWYTIATNTGDRALGEFQIWDTASGDHQSVLFNASHHFGTNSSNDITVLANSRYSGTNFRYIRIKENSTYDGAALQVYVDATSNAVYVAIVGGNAQQSGWVIKDWVADATDPGDVSSWSSFSESCRVDLDNVINGGMISTGEMYLGGTTTQYKAFHDNYHPNADKLTTARTIAGTSFDGTANISISYNNLTNKPTIPTVNNGTLTVQGTGALGGSGTFTANQSSNTTISISHDDTSSQSSVNNSGNTVIQDVTLDGYGHVTGLTSKTLSIPSALTESSSGNRYGVNAFIGSDGVMEVGRYIDFHTSDGSTSDYAHRLTVTGSTLYHSAGISGTSASFSSTCDFNATTRFNFSSGNRGSQFETASDAIQTLRCDSDRFRFYMGSERFTITNTGRVGINDSTPDYTLDVSGNVSNTSIYASHDIVAYSDIRVKKDIETIPDALDKVNKLRGVTYKRTDEGSTDKTMMGVIAQEVEEVIPEVVTTKESDGHKAVAYGNMVGVLIEAVKELTEKVRILEEKLKDK
jgi:hypothetical protein